MEFTVVSAANLPPKPVLAVHAGDVRRQIKLEVNHPFVLPDTGSKPAHVEVSIYQQLASQLLPEDGHSETACTIPVRRPDGTPTHVKLQVQREEWHKAKAKDSQCVQDYLETHKVQQRIQNLIQDVLREAPDDPYQFMLQQLRESQASTSRPSFRSKEPLVPHPPDKPKPPGSRPAPAAGRMLTAPKVHVDKSAWRPSMHIIRSVLESPRCREIGLESILHGVCAKASRGMSRCIMERACTTVASEASGVSELRAIAGSIVRANLATAQHMVKLQKTGILTKWAIRCVLVSAIQRLGSSSDYVGCLDQHTSPQDLVSLKTTSSWAEWLVGDEKPMGPVHMRRVSNASEAPGSSPSNHLGQVP